MSLYKVKKIKNLLSGSDCDDYKMCGQPAVVNVPHPDAIAALNGGKKSYDGPLWIKQDKLDPPVGYRMQFVSTSMDAGWWRVSRIVACETKDNGDVLLTTDNSIYLCEIVK